MTPKISCHLSHFILPKMQGWHYVECRLSQIIGKRGFHSECIVDWMLSKHMGKGCGGGAVVVSLLFQIEGGQDDEPAEPISVHFRK